MIGKLWTMTVLSICCHVVNYSIFLTFLQTILRHILVNVSDRDRVDKLTSMRLKIGFVRLRFLTSFNLRDIFYTNLRIKNDQKRNHVLNTLKKQPDVQCIGVYKLHINNFFYHCIFHHGSTLLIFLQFTSARVACIMEESVVDPEAKTLTTYTKNVTFTRLMVVEEKCVYSVHPTNKEW